MGNSVNSHIIGHITKSEQGIFAFPVFDTSIGENLIKTGRSGGADLDLIWKVVGRDDKVLFVGADIGTLAIPTARICTHVTAIEANPEIFKYLKINAELNNIENIILHQAAAAEDVKKITFVATEQNSGGSKILPLNPHPHYLTGVHKLIELDTVKLDDLLGESKYTAIVMDIEGSEYFALKGMQRILNETEVLFIEWITFHLEFIANISPESFSTELEKHFEYLYIPGMNVYVTREMFPSLLRKLYDMKYHQDLIVFAKNLESIHKIMLN